MTNIVHITYEIAHAPILDNYIFEALSGIIEDMDCMRDDETRDIYLYFGTQKEAENACHLLDENSKTPIEDNEEGLTLMDFIRVSNLKKDSLQDHKLNTRKRIAEIYRKELLKSSESVVKKENTDIV